MRALANFVPRPQTSSPNSRLSNAIALSYACSCLEVLGAGAHSKCFPLCSVTSICRVICCVGRLHTCGNNFVNSVSWVSSHNPIWHIAKFFFV